MVVVRIRDGDTERIQTPAVKDGSLAALTGLSTVVVAIQRVSNGDWYDFADDTFKSSGWTTRQQAMTEVSATLAPGEYRYDFDTSAITNATADDTYMIRVDETGGTAKNVPFHGEIKVDQWVADLATSAELAATEDAIRGADDRDLSELAGAGFVEASDSLEAIRDRGDAAWITATGFSTLADVNAARDAVIAQGDAAWIAATGFATPADVTAARDAVLTQGGTGPWTTADLTGIATLVDVNAARDAVIAQGDSAWITAVGFATPADVTAARDAILTEGGAGPWTIGSLSPTEAMHLERIWQRLHLDKNNPRVDTPTSIKVPADGSLIDIQLDVVGTTITGENQV